MDNLSPAEPQQDQPSKVRQPESPAARDVLAGERWAFVEHRSMAEVAAAERQP